MKVADPTSERRTGPVAADRPGARVICIGETMLMFAPPAYELIEYSDHFAAYNGGAESNIAIGLARLGLQAGWIGKLPDNALGRKIVNEIRSFGVDASAVVWTDTGRVGTFFVEWGAPPRPVKTIYDRANSAATTLEADELDWDYIRRAEWIALTGITPALSETCRLATLEIARRARQAGLKLVFDVNYRSLLWTPQAACEAIRQILPQVNLLVGTEADVDLILDEHPGRERALEALVERYAPEAAVMTLGHEGSIGYDGQAFYRAAGYPLQTVNRLGAGDAFVAGLLYGYIGSGLQAGLHYGTAMSALKLTIPQNIPLIDREDVERLVARRDISIIR